MSVSENGRWWRRPSFSVEDFFKYVGIMVPVIGFLLALWLDVRDIKRALPDFATKRQVANVVRQGNRIHENLNHRLEHIERKKHDSLPPIRMPKDGEEDQ